MQEITTDVWTGLHGQLVDFVACKVKDRSLAEDIVQDVFIKVHSKLLQVRDRDKIRSWIFRIAANTVADHFRRTSKALHSEDIDWETDSQDFNDCVASCLSILMQQLPEKYRQALQLAEVEEKSQLEIAENLKLSYPTARSRVQRARKLLKARMDELYIIKTDPYGNVVVCENRTPCCCNPGC